ncbi:hypothetical protein AB5J72_18010 [Streptomyces sp. CG1]|uniref:hypothetical protein n=1 Tax=Streptomyces sp. CG1 TaxID=1287523 RepID=UPI0034E2C981
MNPDNVRGTHGTATFTARPGPHTLENGLQALETGLITTEGSREDSVCGPATTRRCR